MDLNGNMNKTISIPKLTAKAQKVFNKFIRERDAKGQGNYKSGVQ